MGNKDGKEWGEGNSPCGNLWATSKWLDNAKVSGIYKSTAIIIMNYETITLALMDPPPKATRTYIHGLVSPRNFSATNWQMMIKCLGQKRLCFTFTFASHNILFLLTRLDGLVGCCRCHFADSLLVCATAFYMKIW